MYVKMYLKIHTKIHVKIHIQYSYYLSALLLTPLLPLLPLLGVPSFSNCNRYSSPESNSEQPYIIFLNTPPPLFCFCFNKS